MSSTKAIVGTTTVLSGLVDLGLHLKAFSFPTAVELSPNSVAFLATGTGILGTTGTNIASSEILADSVDKLDTAYKRTVGAQAILASSVGVKVLAQGALLFLYGFTVGDWETVKKYNTEVLIPSAGASTLIALIAPSMLSA